MDWRNVKGGSNPSHFIFEINVGKRRIRHRTTLDFNDQVEYDVIEIQSRSMSDPVSPDIDLKKMK